MKLGHTPRFGGREVFWIRSHYPVGMAVIHILERPLPYGALQASNSRGSSLLQIRRGSTLGTQPDYREANFPAPGECFVVVIRWEDPSTPRDRDGSLVVSPVVYP